MIRRLQHYPCGAKTVRPADGIEHFKQQSKPTVPESFAQDDQNVQDPCWDHLRAWPKTTRLMELVPDWPLYSCSHHRWTALAGVIFAGASRLQTTAANFKYNTILIRQIRPTKFHGFTAENSIDRQATFNSRPFLVSHSNTEQHTNSFFFFSFFFFVRTTTDRNHISDDQVKAPKDFKQRIATQSTIWFARAHTRTPPVASIPKVRSSDVSHQDQEL